eukprot:TRINITY_DN1292_c0_g1_i1.p1 TRINITY_DN1292_c0_g1~~TRINITY_DN1292_c0_g1_i1.p1  ORF type:complete len:441 (+),score=116.37 TRINITY_DN1292_c0_g1_i1:26-1348(+)
MSASASRRLGVTLRHLSPEGTHPLSASPCASSKPSNMFSGVKVAPPDPILGVSLAYKADNDPRKVDLGVGAYRTDDGQPLVLSAVQKAEKSILEAHLNKEYLPIDGLAEFTRLSTEMLFGPELKGKEQLVATMQSLSGTGALRLGAAIISKLFPKGTIVYVSKPTWGNHFNIFRDEGLEVREYRYFDKNTLGLDFDGLIGDMDAAPRGSVFVLHLCAHNPTGVDPSPEQWETIASKVQEKGLFPFVDGAYQGYASGDLDRDAYASRMFLRRGVEFMAAQSYSKNFGLYGERIGALNVVTSSPEAAKAVLSQVKLYARAMYSNPPVHGARIVAKVLSDPALYKEWITELKQMSGRIIHMREELFNALKARGTPGDWSHIKKQIGMFTFTGLRPEQVQVMTQKYRIYMLDNGRISMAGLNSKNVAYVADAIHDAVTNVAAKH